MFSGGNGFVCASVVCALFAAGYAFDFGGDPYGWWKRVVVNLLGMCCSCNSVRLDLMLSQLV